MTHAPDTRPDVVRIALLGAGVLIPLRKKIQKARIDSIMKGN